MLCLIIPAAKRFIGKRARLPLLPRQLVLRKFCSKSILPAEITSPNDESEPIKFTPEVKAEFQRLADLSDQSEVCRMKGLGFYSSGQYQEALEAFDEALTYHPKDLQAIHQKGVVLFRMERAEEAISCWDKVLSFSEDPHCLIMKGEALLFLKHYDEALEVLQKAIDRATDKNINKEIYDDDSHALASANALCGYIYEAKEQYHRASISFKKAVTLAPDDGYFYYRYASALEAINKKEEALLAFNKAVELEPTAEIFFSRGNFFLQQEMYTEAFTDFDKAKEVGCSSPEAEFQLYSSLGSTLLQLGRLDEALSHFNKALENFDNQLEEHVAVAYHNRGLVYSKLRDYASAEADFRDALELDPENPQHQIELDNVLNEKRSQSSAE